MPSLHPGRVDRTATFLAFGFVIAGAWFAGARCNCRPLFFIYGCLCGFFFLRLTLPRGYCANTLEDCWLIGSRVGALLLSAVFCRELAMYSYERHGPHASAPDRCLGCGYLLYGLTVPRCPECGRAFDRQTEPAPPEAIGSTRPARRGGGT
ncbi:MAG: hypothetical protein C4547_06320 [Phycisphaerales bacterium]|nr:MAG: hypothetical protein C4547_06320 [Phycisphaerales bacterium]